MSDPKLPERLATLSAALEEGKWFASAAAVKSAADEIEALRRRIEALEKLTVCYRLRKRPSEKLLDELAAFAGKGGGK